jgi:hypothetical protein
LVIIWSALSGDAKVGGVGMEAVTTTYTNETFSSKEHGWFFYLLLLQYFQSPLYPDGVGLDYYFIDL